MNTVWYVNTNVKYGGEVCAKSMLRSNIAYAYGDAMTALNQINVGDMILLYHSGKGVIAVGVALSTAANADNMPGCEKEAVWEDETRALRADWFKHCDIDFDNPIPADIVREFWRNPFFNTTCTSMDIDFKKFFKVLSDRAK